MSNRVKITPWIDWTEWSYVRDLLLCNNETSRLGIEIVDMWRSRGKVPHSVDCTACLIELGLNDKSGMRSESELRLAYSMVVTRAVNGLVDPSQQGFYADSVSNLAERIGLPQWFVELRHDATHNQLPTLSVLRSAALQLLEWLQFNYWHPQSEYLQQVSTLCLPSNMEAVNSDGTRSELLFGKASTVTSQLFAPLFLQSILTPVDILDAAQGEEDLLARLETRCREDTELWSGTLDALQAKDPQGLHLLLCCVLRDAIQKAIQTSIQTSPTLPIACVVSSYTFFRHCYWIAHLGSRGLVSQNIFRLEHNVSQVAGIIATCSEGEILLGKSLLGKSLLGKILETVFAEVAAIYGDSVIALFSDSGLPTSEPSKGFSLSHSKVLESWPIGCPCGSLVSDTDLYLVDYSSS